MGQYYHPLLISDDGKVTVCSSHDFGCGVKLMEHSWVGNDFVNAILGLLDEAPMRVAWIGDYATDTRKPYEFGDGFITNLDGFMPFYNLAWEGGGAAKLDKGTARYTLDNDHADCFLVNETKGLFVDMARYTKENNSGGWCINPLPLLTCIGNGLGGGDYYGDAGQDDIGTWAFDKISVTTLRPCNIEEIVLCFCE